MKFVSVRQEIFRKTGRRIECLCVLSRIEEKSRMFAARWNADRKRVRVRRFSVYGRGIKSRNADGTLFSPCENGADSGYYLASMHPKIGSTHPF